jgi:hypothetical protein
VRSSPDDATPPQATIEAELASVRGELAAMREALERVASR